MKKAAKLSLHAFLSAALIALVLQPASAADQLRWKLKQGDAFKITIKQNQKQVAEAAGQTFEVPVDMTMELTWKVQEVTADGNYKIVQTMDRMALKVAAPNMNIEFDTSSDTEPSGLGKTLVDAMKPMIGAEVVQTITPRGEVTDVQVPEAALQGLQQNPLLGQVLTEDAFKDMVGKSAAVFPANALQKGDSWTGSQQTKTPAGTMKMANEYTYDGMQSKDGRQLAKILVNSDISIAADAANPLGTISISAQDNQGAIYFDVEKGYMTESTMIQKMTMEMAVAGQAIKQKIDSTMSMTLKPVK